MQLPNSVQNILAYGQGYNDGMKDGHICGFHDAIVCAVHDLTGLLKKYQDMEKEYAGLQAKAYRERMENKPQLESATENHALWISVEDALPEIKEFHISDTVLCYCDSGALAIARLEENGFGQVGFNCEKGDEYRSPAGKVLYWMPIPEIPEKE